jgi:hypothetical protein
MRVTQTVTSRTLGKHTIYQNHAFMLEYCGVLPKAEINLFLVP